MIELAPGLIYHPGFYNRAQQEALVADLRAWEAGGFRAPPCPAGGRAAGPAGDSR